MKLCEMDEQVTYVKQLQGDDGPVMLINQFNVAPADAERLVEVSDQPRRDLSRIPTSETMIPCIALTARA